MARTQGVGVLSRELAINAGITGPMLRASGVNYDIRKVDKYGIYDRFEFRVPLGDHGDVYDRYMIRVLEMRESLKILQQALAGHSRRPDHGSEGEAARLSPESRRSYGRIEAPKGELGFYLISDGTPESVSLPRAPAQFHQPDDPRRHVPRPHRRRRGGDSRQRGHRAGGGGPVDMLQDVRLRQSCKGMARNGHAISSGSYYRRGSRLTTVQYPEERAAAQGSHSQFPVPRFRRQRSRSRAALRRLPDLREGMSAAVHLHHQEQDKKPDYIGKMQFQPKVFDIDISVCMSCQICVEVCPFEAIKMDKEFELSTTDRFDGLLLHKDELAKSNEYYHKIHPDRGG